MLGDAVYMSIYANTLHTINQEIFVTKNIVVIDDSYEN